MKNLIFICLIFLPLTITAQERKMWNYPIKLGSEEWRVTSYAEKVEKSQPPKELIKSWDTETLFQYCVDYPFNHVTLMFNNPNDGFKRMYEQSSVWQEYVQRKDALGVFIRYFEDRPYKRLFEMSNIEVRNDELMTLYYLEKLVSETDFALHLYSLDKKKLANTILQSHQSKKDFPDEFIGFHYNSSLVALLKIFESEQALSPQNEITLTKFRKKTGNEYFVDDGMDSEIITKAFNYINK